MSHSLKFFISQAKDYRCITLKKKIQPKTNERTRLHLDSLVTVCVLRLAYKQIPAKAISTKNLNIYTCTTINSEVLKLVMGKRNASQCQVLHKIRYGVRDVVGYEHSKYLWMGKFIRSFITCVRFLIVKQLLNCSYYQVLVVHTINLTTFYNIIVEVKILLYLVYTLCGSDTLKLDFYYNQTLFIRLFIAGLQRVKK